MDQAKHAEKKSSVIGIYGKRGTGKSTYMREAIFPFHRRQIIIDCLGDYDAEEFESHTDCLDFFGEDPNFFRVKFSDYSDLPFACGLAWDVGNCLLVIDEANLSLRPNSSLDPLVKDVIFRGRHRKISLVIIAQRANTVAIDARSQFTELIIFRQTEPNDIRWINQVAPRVLDDLPVLKTGEYYRITPESAEKYKLNSIYDLPSPRYIPPDSITKL